MLASARSLCRPPRTLDTALRRGLLTSRCFSSAPKISYPRWINNRADPQPRRPGSRGVVAVKAKRLPDAPVVQEIDHVADAEPRVVLLAEDDAASPPAAPPSSSDAASAPPSSNNDDDGPSDDRPPDNVEAAGESSPDSQTSAISKPAIPDYYPQVLALPIARRPLFPGFYKAVVVRNPNVVAAIEDMLRRGQAYIGAFLLKDADSDSDVLTDIDSVHRVGVFAQITSVFPVQPDNKEGEKDSKALTVVLFPHRRIRITSLLGAEGQAKVEDAATEVDISREGPPPHGIPRMSAVHRVFRVAYK